MHFSTIKKIKNVLCDYSLWVSKNNDSNGTRDKGRNWERSVVWYIHLPCSSIVLFESGLRIVVNIYCKLLEQPLFFSKEIKSQLVC